MSPHDSSTGEERRQRMAAWRAAERRRERRRQIIRWSAGGLAVAAVAGGIAAAVISSSSSSSSEIPGVRSFGGLSAAHVTGPVTYSQTPPVGGPHNPVLLNCGVYTSPVPNVNAVHSMEHGAVWITYRPDLSRTDVATLRAAVRGTPYTILSPYPGLPSPVVASAWGRQRRLTRASDRRLAEFIHAYAQGPQTPERGAPCAGGIGVPAG